MSGRALRSLPDMPAQRDWAKPVQITGVLVLCAIGAELLAAYSDNTGDPGGIAFSVVFFAALYGAPALLARELVRRRGWGWPSMLLLFAALGVAQACLIDQSLFSTDYMGYDGWEETREATLIPALGLSAYNAYNFVLGHVIFSFGAPIAVGEAWRPKYARDPWLGRVGIGIALLAYAGAAALIVSDPESRSASPSQVLISAAVVVALVVGAAIVGSRHVPAEDGRHPVPIWATLLLGLVAALVSVLGGETWTGFVIGVVITGAVALGLLAAARRPGWSVHHIAAVGLGFLLVRGLLAFTYFPLLGDVAPIPKYVHNTTMLLVVAVAAWFALRPRAYPGPAHSGVR